MASSRVKDRSCFCGVFQRRKNGKPHTYWALVESYRTAKGSRQRVVAYLGELSGSEQDGWAKLGSHLNGHSSACQPQRSLFDPPRRDVAGDDEPLLVKLSSVRLERPRDFGDVWLAWGLWRMLGLDDLLQELMEEGREDVSWSTMAAILTIARFCEPSSELHIADTWYRRTALEELLGAAPEQVHTDAAVQGAGSSIAAQGGAGKASAAAVGRTVRPEMRPAVVRRDKHILRRRDAGLSAGEARLFA